MKPAPHLDHDQLTLLYFNEAPVASREHLTHCETCGARYRDLAHFLDSLRDVPVPDQGPYWEQRLWTEISPRIAQTLRRPSRFGFRSWFPASLPVWMPISTLAALVLAAFLIGRYTQPAANAASISPQARDRVLLFTLGDHLDRSQIVLAELVNAPAGKSLNIAAEQQLAGNLVGENRLLRQIVARKGDRSDSAVLDDLERVLIDIAHSPSEVSPDELDRLRQRIEAQGLLFKVRVISTNVREKGMKL